MLVSPGVAGAGAEGDVTTALRATEDTSVVLELGSNRRKSRAGAQVGKPPTSLQAPGTL